MELETCCYCEQREVVDEPVSLLICGPCLIRATMLGWFSRLLFEIEHGPVVV